VIIKKVTQKGSFPIAEVAKTVPQVQNPRTQKIIRNLIDSMRYHNLVGMAAPQIGKSVKIFVIEVRKTTYRKDLHEKSALQVFVNPRLVAHSKARNRDYEGCGSVESATLFGPVERWNTVTVKALDAEGKPFVCKAKGFFARVLQHEYDHLRGKLFIDKVKKKEHILSKAEYVSRFRKV
jgi:peptide deformylase